jgi:hypothetical protein
MKRRARRRARQAAAKAGNGRAHEPLEAPPLRRSRGRPRRAKAEMSHG